jgi:2-amino-4-hydroxy-6-hydroxymethyldihydropteridine diphosphokinase
MERVGIGLGANLGDRKANLAEAIWSLKGARCSGHLLISGLYETAPIGCPAGSPDFYNCVVEIETNLTPPKLLNFTQSIEKELGRPQVRDLNDPRPVDLDLLYFGRVSLETEHLTLPHPRMSERAFVLLPLQEIRPELAPKDKLDKIEGQPVRKLMDSGWVKIP